MTAAADRFFLLGTSERLRALEGVRGWAVLMVFWVHLFAYGNPAQTRIGRAIIETLHAGHVGVDLFFMLSGFLIVRGAITKAQPVRIFLAQRLRRLIPPHWVLLGVVILLYATQHRFFSPWTVVLNLVFAQVFVAGATPINFVSWSLGYELVFYLAVAMLMALQRRFHVRRHWLWAGGLLSVLILFFPTPILQNVGVVLPDPARFMAFAWGAAMADLYVREEQWRRAAAIFRALSFPALAGVVALRAFFGNVGDTGNPLEHFMLFASLDLCFFLTLGAALVPNSFTYRLFDRRGWRIMGAMSYSIYLSHALIGLATTASIAGRFQGWNRTLVHFTSGGLVTLVVSALSFHFLEKRYFEWRMAQRRSFHMIGAATEARDLLAASQTP